MMQTATGPMMVIALVYFLVVVTIVAFVLTALWRMVRAQEAIAAMLADIRDRFTPPPAA